MRTPLHKAASQGRRDVSVALLDAGAEVNALDAGGRSPLDTLVLSAPHSVHGDAADGKDWKGTQEALLRCGGGHSAVDLSGGCGGESARRFAKVGVEGPGASTGVPSGTGDGLNKTSASPPELLGLGSGSVDLDDMRSIDPRRLGPRQETVGDTSVETVDGRASDTATSGLGTAQRRSVVGGQPGAKGGDGGAGIPCRECRLPTVAMVRGSCCGGLLCKSCQRKLRFGRRPCRLCRDASRSASSPRQEL